jgi:hypothetical protein
LVCSSYKTSIDKPWEDDGWKENKSDINYIWDEWVWEPSEIDQVLTNLYLDNLTKNQLDEQEHRLTLDAKNARINASKYRTLCLAEIDYLEDYIEAYSETSSGQYNLDSLAAMVKFALNLISPQRAELITHLIFLKESCADYGNYWESTMSNSTDALTSSMNKVEKNYSELRRSFDELNQSGLCDDDYTRAGHKECLEVRAAIISIESGSTEGSYGKYNVVKKQVEGIQNEVYNSRPNIINYSITMNMIWNDSGVLDTLDSLNKKAKLSMELAEKEFNNTKGDTEFYKGKVENQWEDIADEELKKITSAVTVSGTIGAVASGTIAERYESLNSEKEEAENNYTSAINYRTKTTWQGYLKHAITTMRSANESYGVLYLSLPILKTDAQTVVNAQKSEAQDKIEEAQKIVSEGVTSDYVRTKLNESKNYFSKGEKSDKLGDQFYYYSEAAKAARAAISKSENQSFNESIELAAMVVEIEAMIKDAKADEINVYSQEKSLDSINGVDEPWVRSQLLQIKKEIIEAAKLKYSYLEDRRAELIQQIKLVGGDADDLLTDMKKAEKDFVNSDGTFDYSKGLGDLKNLAKEYDRIDGELDEEMDKIVKGSLMSEAEVFVDSVALDTPSNITVDILIINTNEYQSKNVEVDVSLPVAVDLMFTDIINGSENVNSVLMRSGNKATLYLKEVKPYTRQRIVFQTTDTIAHTTKSKKEAKGLGDGSALVEEEITFKLDSAVNSLEIPSYMKNVKIDGYSYERVLPAGSHKLTAKYPVPDAYNETITNIKATPIGLNSQVAYEIVIDPRIDLDETMIFIDAGAKISSLNVFSLSGEGIGKKKKISEGKYSYVVSDLNAGSKATIKVSYILENASSYIEAQLALFNDTNLSSAVNSLVLQARSAYNGGNTTVALSKIKEAQAQMKKEQNELSKTKKKINSITEEIKDELSEIKAALLKAGGSNSSFYAKLQARSDELERRLNESATKSPNDALLDLEKVDLNWRSKEMKSLRKEKFKEYNNLKERFADAGNMSTPSEFILVENSLNQLEVSGRLEYAVDLISAMESAKKIVDQAERSVISQRSGLKNSFDALKDSVNNNLKSYAAEIKAAKGTEFASMFRWTEKEVKDKISDVEKLMDDGEIKEIERKLKTLNRTGEDVAGTLSLLANQSKNKLDLIEKLYESSKSGMDESSRSTIETKISSMKRLISGGQHVNSLRAGNKILEDIKAAKSGSDNTLLLLGISALAILGVIAAYMFKQKDLLRKDEKKELKKLKKADAGSEPEKD